MPSTASPPPTWPPAAPWHPGIPPSTPPRSPTCTPRCAERSSPPNISQVDWSSRPQQKSSKSSKPGPPQQHKARKSSYETSSWVKQRNEKQATVRWQFTASDARTKLARLYPTLVEG